MVQVLGGYCEGPKFDQRPAAEQRRRAVEFFQQRDVPMVWDNSESVLPQFSSSFSRDPTGSAGAQDDRSDAPPALPVGSR